MDIVIFQEENILEESLSSFQDLLFSSQMKYLSSDLLNEGLSPLEIRRAVKKAMTICQTSKIKLWQHFLPVYTQVNGILMNDCKLSQLGYGLVLLNADVNNPNAAQWQIKVMKYYLENI